ncbi:MAG: hypothetical protein A2493_02570 [Candidatus Magasanikbacteria bacterium RIFOXYC12_FULL_33_11]|uniref:Uncharacterized protein n=1 Tax=Candidatus Magasanikbacteria bacterium RIFOXYC12_FULL_33_11 TaxID=1798701 RepID=A0A1F6NQ88_9BACT|nr:MAG: hypothetical protein A2493_02570 [Candidatus Magasanikbacteria bacterium RIFOXYC12_FULL_33_11]
MKEKNKDLTNLPEPVTLFRVRVNEGIPPSMTILWSNGKHVTFEGKYISFPSLERAIEVLVRAAINGEHITMEDCVALINKMWGIWERLNNT